jgi:hypothetical protein
VDENLFYMSIDKQKADPSRRSQLHDGEVIADDVEYTGNATQPPYLFKSGETLLAMTKKHNVCGIFSSQIYV